MDQQYIYVICEQVEGTPVKIGFSATPEKRLRQLQTGHAGKLILFHKEEVEVGKVKALERVIHKELRHKKHRGEWFNLTPEDAVVEIKHALIRYGDIDDLAHRIRSRTL
jgi:hypothetical protein